jgi:protein-L-isoaspartate(D-aspartate) O-methyltransferase
MRSVERHNFVPENYRDRAYSDGPLPIGHGQTISQPYIVAFMTEQLQVSSQHKILEIGTGSGYQAAILGELAKHVFTIEIIPELAEGAKNILNHLSYKNITVRAGDGYKGWPEEAPFERIMVTAAPTEVPLELIDQLAPGGRMILPVGAQFLVQYLWVIEKDDQGTVTKEKILPVRFVPMVKE